MKLGEALTLPPRPAVALLPLLVLLAGCGGAEYQKRFDTTLTHFGRAEKFEALYSPSDLGGANVTLRIPKLFTGQAMDLREARSPVGAQQAFPPITSGRKQHWPFPGFVFSYRAEAKDPDGRTVPYYLYLGMQESWGATKDQGSLRDRIKKTLAEAPQTQASNPDWTGPIACETDSGDAPTVNWHKITAAGEMSTEIVDGNNQPAIPNLKSTLEIWIHETPFYTVYVGWRVPDAIASTVDLETLPKLVAGTVKVKPPAEWKAGPAQLGNETTCGAFKFQMPNGYQLVKTTPQSLPTSDGAVNITTMVFSAGPDRVLAVSSIVPPTEEHVSDGSLELLAKLLILPVMQAETKNASLAVSSFEHGISNNLRIVKTPLINAPKPVTLYVGGDGVVFFSALGGGPDADLLEASILSIRRP